MAEGKTKEGFDIDLDVDTDNASDGMAAVMAATQDAADKVRSTAERAAAKLPDAVAGAQTAAAQTQKRLDEMPNQALMMGTSFSLGLGLGLFLTGANRLLIALAVAPAVAMLMSLMGRDKESSASWFGSNASSDID